MLRRTLKRTKRWYGRNILGKSQVEMWSPLELERRIRKLERKKQQYKEEMDEAKKAYDEKIHEAKEANETRLPEIKSEASQLLSTYEKIRSQWVLTLNGLRFMQQAALAKQIDASGPEALPSDMNPAQFEQSAQAVENKIEDFEDYNDKVQVAADRFEDISQGGSAHMESMADQRVEAAIDAARDGDSVPSLDELADETFSSESTRSEAKAKATTETNQRAETF